MWHGRVVVGYDRPLGTFFAQAIAIDADGEDVTVIWQGTYPGELATPRSAMPASYTSSIA